MSLEQQLMKAEEKLYRIKELEEKFIEYGAKVQRFEDQARKLQEGK